MRIRIQFILGNKEVMEKEKNSDTYKKKLLFCEIFKLYNSYGYVSNSF